MLENFNEDFDTMSLEDLTSWLEYYEDRKDYFLKWAAMGHQFGDQMRLEERLVSIEGMYKSEECQRIISEIVGALERRFNFLYQNEEDIFLMEELKSLTKSDLFSWRRFFKYLAKYNKDDKVNHLKRRGMAIDVVLAGEHWENQISE